jgi:hypothetical protein
MKCIKNFQTGNIIRVDDVQARQMVGSTWSYVSKAEWKSATRKVVKEEVIVEEPKTISEKQISRKKNKK